MSGDRSPLHHRSEVGADAHNLSVLVDAAIAGARLIGAGFTIAAQGDLSRLVVFIDYPLPSRGRAHGRALIFGPADAALCPRRMRTDAVVEIAGAASL